ncbi:MAG TPA: DUF3426 domain-containing protein [Burkholderiales bacterium]
MYTRCPECQTAFRITIAQLKARDGLVRCGRCDSVFRADLHLFAPPADAASEARRDHGADGVHEQEALRLRDKEIPVITDSSIFQAPRRGLPTPVWALGVLALMTLLVGQFAYFYRDELAQVPALRPHLARFCAHLGCELAPLVGAAVPELIETRIAPHPRYGNVLRLRARLVNRSERDQPLPLLQVSLTDSEGRLLARRTFAPRDYVQPPARADAPMSPNIVVDALLDVTNPDEKAAGFEIQLFAAAG